MAETLSSWVETQEGRRAEAQLRKVENAKLVATFAAGVSATLVTTGLQVGPTWGADALAIVALAVCIVQTGRVFASAVFEEVDFQSAITDAARLRENDHASVASSAESGSDDAPGRLVGDLLGALRRRRSEAISRNDLIVLAVEKSMKYAVAWAIVAGVMAAGGLLVPSFGPTL